MGLVAVALKNYDCGRAAGRIPLHVHSIPRWWCFSDACQYPAEWGEQTVAVEHRVERTGFRAINRFPTVPQRLLQATVHGETVTC